MFHVFADQNLALTSTFAVSATVAMLITGAFIPLVLGLLTKFTVPTWVQGGANIILVAVAGLLTTNAASDGSVTLGWDTLWPWIVGVVASLAAYYQVWKPLGMHSADPSGKIAHFGIGPKAA